MKDMLVIPTGGLADASLAIARSSESQSIVDHSIRSFLFARLLADEEGCLNDANYNEDLLFAATVMHDLGLGEHATGEARFEVEGAIVAHATRSEAAAPPGSLAFDYSANTERRARNIASARIGAHCAKPPHHPSAHKCSSEGVR